MAIAASEIPNVQSLLQNRAQLKSRLVQANAARTLDDMFHLVQGTTVEQTAFTLAQTTMTQFLENAIAGIEAQLIAAGVTIDV